MATVFYAYIQSHKSLSGCIVLLCKNTLNVADNTVNLTRGAMKWACTTCEKPITGSATSVRAHLLAIFGVNTTACLEVSEDAQTATRALASEYPANKATEPAPSFGISSSSSSHKPGIAARSLPEGSQHGVYIKSFTSGIYSADHLQCLRDFAPCPCRYRSKTH